MVEIIQLQIVEKEKRRGCKSQSRIRNDLINRNSNWFIYWPPHLYGNRFGVLHPLENFSWFSTSWALSPWSNRNFTWLELSSILNSSTETSYFLFIRVLFIFPKRRKKLKKIFTQTMNSSLFHQEHWQEQSSFGNYKEYALDSEFTCKCHIRLLFQKPQLILRILF